MLKIECNKKDTKVVAAGSLKAIAIEMGAALASLYEQIYAENPGAANALRGIITGLVTDPNSPIWTTEKKHAKFSFVRDAKNISAQDIRTALDAGATADVIKALLED